MFKQIYRLTRIRLFLSRQINQIKEGRWVVIKQKLRKLTNAILIAPIIIITIPIVIILRLIKPILWVRVGYFWAFRIGHFVFDVEYYLSEKKLGLHPNKVIDIFKGEEG